MRGSGPRTYPTSAFATAEPLSHPGRGFGTICRTSRDLTGWHRGKVRPVFRHLRVVFTEMLLKDRPAPEGKPAWGAGVDRHNGHGVLRVVLSASVHAAAMFAR
jgi:hypothetical protein